MSSFATRALLIVSIPLGACIVLPPPRPNTPPPPATGTEQAQPQPQPQPQPVVDTRNPGQIVVDWMTAAGFTCAMEETRWQCTGPNAVWPLYVSYVNADESTNTPSTIWFDQYEYRAFGKPCANFTDAMNDLATAPDEAGDGFSATCDDTTQMFRLNTHYRWGSGEGATAEILASWWTFQTDHSATSLALLKSVHAIRKPTK